jgi:hypothetical protein
MTPAQEMDSEAVAHMRGDREEDGDLDAASKRGLATNRSTNSGMYCGPLAVVFSDGRIHVRLALNLECLVVQQVVHGRMR